MSDVLVHTPLAYSCRLPTQVSWCWLTVLRVGGSYWAIFAQEEGYQGPSITNTIAEAIKAYHYWADVYEWPEPQGLLYVEHYLGSMDEWDLVQLDATGHNPEWTRVPEPVMWELVEALYSKPARLEATR